MSLVVKGWPVSGAVFSADGVYRYRLWRRWGKSDGRHVGFVMLNPSEANEAENDATIRRCIGFAKSSGYDGLEVVNAFAYRAPRPGNLWRAQEAGHDIVGPVNDEQILDVAQRVGLLVAAWSELARHGDRERALLELLATASRQVHVLALTKGGSPRHPLYLPAVARPTLWKAAA